MAGKLCPFAFPKAARNSRSQFSISADFSIRLRGAASHRARAYAGFFTARVSHHHHPLKKKGKKRREREKRRLRGLPSLLFSSHRVRRYTAHRERRRGLKSENPLFPPSPPDRACKTEMELPLGGIGLLRANLPPTFHQQGKRIYRDIYLSIYPSSSSSFIDGFFCIPRQDSSSLLSSNSIDRSALFRKRKEKKRTVLWEIFKRRREGGEKTRSTDGTSWSVIPPRDGR